MIKEIFQKSLEQPQKRHLLLHIWSWIYANSDEHGVYYGNSIEIQNACRVHNYEVGLAIQLQDQWNTETEEKTIIIKKDPSGFVPVLNAKKKLEEYVHEFKLDFTKLPNNYNPLVIIFNEPKPVKHQEQLPVENTELVGGLGIEMPPVDESKKKKKQGRKRNVPITLRNTFLDIYKEFFISQTNVPPPPYTATDIQKIEKIILYLLSIPKPDNSPTEEKDAILVFEIMLRNWHMYPDNIRFGVKPQEILYNISTIIAHLKMNRESVIKSKTSRAAEYEEKIKHLAGDFKLHAMISSIGKPKY